MAHHGQDILKTAARTMVDHNMVAGGESVLVAVSGGVDSVTLLWCLIKLAERFSLSRIGVAHFNHGLRGQAADNDMTFVRRLADGYGLPCHTEIVDVAGFAARQRLSTEDAARRMRYDFFDRTAGAHGYDKIATAHHADDNAEQVLMGLLRGSGPTGLSGIPPVRQGRIIRPFINLIRADIEAVAAREHLEFILDATNNDLNFLRNRVRHQLIPHLRQAFNINIVENLNRLADISRQENAWLEQLISTIIPEVLVAQGKDEIVFSASLLMAQPPAVRRRLIRRALEMVKGDLRRITLAQIDAIVELIGKNQMVTLDLPDGILAAKSGDRLTFCPASAWQTDMAASERVFSYTLFPGGAADVSLAIPEIGARIDFSVITREDVDSVIAGDGRVAFFDLERLTLPLTIRNVLPGDRFVPLGMTGRQKVKDFFINRKIPRDHRRACPVVVSGGQIIWLAGFRSADPVKITPATSRVLKAEVFPL